MVRFTLHRRTGQAINENIVEFDLLWRAAESEMVMGRGFPEQSISISRKQNAGLPC